MFISPLQLEKKVNEYNSLARKLKLIPADAENAHGIDYELRLNFHSVYSQHSPMLDFVSTIKVGFGRYDDENLLLGSYLIP